MEFFTIGVYHTSETAFFEKLAKNGIDTFCDIRLRRGVRGAEYAFANSQRLQDSLAELGIRYMHIPELAPTADIIKLQHEADKKAGIPFRQRSRLDESFKKAYEERILSVFDLDAFMKQLKEAGAKKIAFFCVEQDHTACHRSLLAERIAKRYDLKIYHL